MSYYEIIINLNLTALFLLLVSLVAIGILVAVKFVSDWQTEKTEAKAKQMLEMRNLETQVNKTQLYGG